MKFIHKNRFFLPIAALLAVFGTLACVSFNSPKASALTGCSPHGTRTVSYIDYNGESVSMGTYPYYQTLRYGNKNSCVASLQRMANVLCTPGTRLAVDGDFGPRTYRAIRSLQYAIGYEWWRPVQVNGADIIIDGVAGPQTWSILQAFAGMGSPTQGGPVDCTYIS